MIKKLIPTLAVLVLGGCGGGSDNNKSAVPSVHSFTFENVTLTAPAYDVVGVSAGIPEGTLNSDCIKISTPAGIGSAKVEVTIAAGQFSLVGHAYLSDDCSGIIATTESDSGVYNLVQTTQTSSQIPVTEVEFLYSDESTETRFFATNEESTEVFEFYDLDSSFHIRHLIGG